MILSYEHAKLKKNYAEKELEKLPIGHDTMIHQTHKGVYIKSWPGHPELKGKRIADSKPEAKLLRKLLAQRNQLEIELAEALSYLQFHDPGCTARPAPWMDRKFFESCIAYADGNPKPKPKYAPSLGDKTFRSKSELNIAQLLTDLGYEFVYETEFDIIEGVVEYPDFVVWVPEIGRSFIIEHFGLMDKKEYRSDAGWKINHYVEFGVMPGRDIIFTYESDKLQLDIDLVKEQINALIMANTMPAK